MFATPAPSSCDWKTGRLPRSVLAFDDETSKGIKDCTREARRVWHQRLASRRTTPRCMDLSAQLGTTTSIRACGCLRRLCLSLRGCAHGLHRKYAHERRDTEPSRRVRGRESLSLLARGPFEQRWRHHKRSRLHSATSTLHSYDFQQNCAIRSTSS